MGVKLVSASGGSVEINPPATASNFVATMPAGTGTVSVNGVSSNIVSGTAQNSTSGTSIDFTSIPSWVRRVTVMFSGVSLTGTDALLIQLGDSGGIETTGYSSAVAFVGVSTSGNSRTDGYVITVSGSATNTYSGSVVLVNVSGNTWIANGGMIYDSTTPTGFVMPSTGIKTLSAQLDRLSVTRTGTNTFDAGSINILYE